MCFPNRNWDLERGLITECSASHATFGNHYEQNNVCTLRSEYYDTVLRSYAIGMLGLC